MSEKTIDALVGHAEGDAARKASVNCVALKMFVKVD